MNLAIFYLPVLLLVNKDIAYNILNVGAFPCKNILPGYFYMATAVIFNCPNIFISAKNISLHLFYFKLIYFYFKLIYLPRF